MTGPATARQAAPPPNPADTAPELSRDAILSIADSDAVQLHVPEWRGNVYVKPMTGVERDRFEAEIQRRRKGEEINTEGLKAWLVCLVTTDAAGKALFKPEDAAALQKKSAVALNRIYEVAARLSGLSDQDVDELAGN